MKQIVSSVFEELTGIGSGVFQSIRDDIFFPVRILTPEDKFLRKIKGQHGIIRSQQDQLSFSAGKLVEKDRDLAKLNTLLAEKNKECVRLKVLVSSLEFALREESSRKKRKR